MCKHCGRDLRQRSGGAGKAILFLILAFGALAIFGIIAEQFGNATSSTADHQRAAFRACQEFIEKRLRAPASAKHPAFDDASVSNQHPIYVVTSQVDSQNAFGALLRTQYTCEVERIDTSFRLVSLKTVEK